MLGLFGNFFRTKVFFIVLRILLILLVLLVTRQSSASIQAPFNGLLLSFAIISDSTVKILFPS